VDITWEANARRLAVRYEDGTDHLYQWDGTEFKLEAEE